MRCNKDKEHRYMTIQDLVLQSYWGFLMVSILQLWNHRGCLKRHLNFIKIVNSKGKIEIIEDTNKKQHENK